MDVLPFNAELLLDNSTIEKHSAPSGNWIVEGYASTSDLDSQNHIVTKEAIKMGAESLKRYDTVLFNHDVDRPIGKVVSSEGQDTKLWVKVSISKTEPKLWEQIKEGTLSKFSIRGNITDSEYYTDERSIVAKEILMIKGMELHEISIVSVPANPEAKSISYYIEKALSNDSNLRAKIREVLADIQKDKKSFESAITHLELGLPDLQGEDKAQVETIIRSLTSLVGRVYQKSGGQIMDDIKKEEVVVEEKKEEVVIDKAVEEKVAPVKKVEIDVSALNSVVTQLQEMVKGVTEKSEQVDAQMAEVKKAKDEVENAKTELVKSIAELGAIVKEIPIRRGAAPKEEEVVPVKKELAETEEYQKANPANQLHMLISGLQQ